MASAPKKQRFVHRSKEERRKKQDDLQNDNTLANERKAVRAFTAFLDESGVEDTDFFQYTDEQLNEHLSAFWFAARKEKDGEMYKISSLENMRYSLNRALRRQGRDIDITKRECVAFTSCITAFEDAKKELKQAGKGYRKPTKYITRQHAYQIYNSTHLDAQAGPVQLRNKVEWDIRFYFCRRGKENLHEFTKDFFKLKHNEEQDLRYIEKVKDEKTKNHRDSDGPIISGHMPELKGSPFCPVTSFLTYLYSLDPQCPWLFQTPKLRQFPANGKGVWYSGRMGHNKLDTFVSRMSKLCGIDEGYSNHSLRSSGITTLKKTKKFSDKCLMAFSGHMSLAGLNAYDRVTDEDKIAMGFSLSESLIIHQPVQIIENPALPAPPQMAIEAPNQMQVAVQQPQNAANQLALPAPNAPNVLPENAIIPLQPPDDFDEPEPTIDLLNLIAEAEQQHASQQVVTVESQMESHQNQNTIMAKQIVKKTTSSPQIPVFHNCTFSGNVTINITKN